MGTRCPLLALNALLAAALACNLPGGYGSLQPPDMTGTVSFPTSSSPLTETPAPAPTISVASTLPDYAVSPTPTVLAPAAPTSFRLRFKCTRSNSPMPHNDVHVDISWAETAVNPDGYYIFRDGSLLATLGSAATAFSDDTSMSAVAFPGNTPPSIKYAVQAFNGAGTSRKVSKSISCFD